MILILLCSIVMEKAEKERGISYVLFTKWDMAGKIN